MSRFRQQFLKPARGAAGAQVVATEFLDQFLIAVDDPIASLDAGFGREALAALTGDLETTSGRGS